MRVSIFSVHAAVAGRACPVWTGLLTPRDLGSDYLLDEERSEDTLLEALFRYFNRVDEGDGERLENIRYRLPSLSMGDYVTLSDTTTASNGTTYRVDSVGFTKITGTEDGFRLTMPGVFKQNPSCVECPECGAEVDTREARAL